jgi:cytochrome b561
MTGLPDSEQKWQMYGLHKATGIVVLLLVIFRILWRLINITPNLPTTMIPILQNGYKLGVKSMYIFMLVMPLSGLLMSLYSGREISVYGFFTIKAFETQKELATQFHTMHVYSGIILACIIGVHTMLAIYHHFIVKDRLLVRMIIGK